MTEWTFETLRNSERTALVAKEEPTGAAAAQRLGLSLPSSPLTSVGIAVGGLLAVTGTTVGVLAATGVFNPPPAPPSPPPTPPLVCSLDGGRRAGEPFYAFL